MSRQTPGARRRFSHPWRRSLRLPRQRESQLRLRGPGSGEGGFPCFAGKRAGARGGLPGHGEVAGRIVIRKIPATLTILE
jgi:hypothetical protein